jgi:hypothetical protein
MSSRQQLPPQIKKIEVVDRRTGKVVVRYQLTVDSGVNLQTGKRQQVRRRYATEKQARDALAEIGTQASTGAFVPRKAVTVEQLCADWLASLHNARATTINGYTYVLAPLRERHGSLPAQKLTRPDLDNLLFALRTGGTTTAKGHTRRLWAPRSLNAAINAWRLVLAYGCERRELALQLAERTRELGYPVSRVAISKIEGNFRSGKLDVAELFALAVALEIPPALLLLPAFPDEEVEVLPGLSVSVLRAREWICGHAPIPVKIEADGVSGHIMWSNAGVGLVEAVASRASLDKDIADMRRIARDRRIAPDTAESARRLGESLEDKLPSATTQIDEAKAALWDTEDLSDA